TTATLAQSELVIGSSAAAGRDRAKPTPARAGRWQVPVCVTAGAAAPPVCHVLTEPRETLTVASGCPAWIFANAGARGYYRTAYPPDMIRAMAPHVETDLTAAERFSLIGDEWALVRAGRHSAADYLTLVAGFGREHMSGILKEITDRL